MGSFDVALPVNKRAIFPLFCVVCEKPDPNSRMSISILGANTGTVTEEVVDNLLDVGSGIGSNTSTKFEGIPVCSGCESGLKWYHRLLKLATYTIWLPALLVMFVMPGPMFIRVAVFLAIVVAPPILSMIFPPAFGATVVNGQANFEFKSRRLAEEFMRINCPEAVVDATETSPSKVADAA